MGVQGGCYRRYIGVQTHESVGRVLVEGERIPLRSPAVGPVGAAGRAPSDHGMLRRGVVDHDEVGRDGAREASEVGAAVAGNDDGSRRQRRKLQCGVCRIILETW